MIKAIKPTESKLAISEGASATPPTANFTGTKNSARVIAARSGTVLLIGTELLVDSIIALSKFVDCVEFGSVDGIMTCRIVKSRVFA